MKQDWVKQNWVGTVFWTKMFQTVSLILTFNFFVFAHFLCGGALADFRCGVELLSNFEQRQYLNVNSNGGLSTVQWRRAREKLQKKNDSGNDSKGKQRRYDYNLLVNSCSVYWVNRFGTFPGATFRKNESYFDVE